MSIIARLSWIIPFVLFVGGYYSISWLVSSETIKTPSLTGKRLQDGVALLTPYQLNVRILGEIEDPTLPEGTVINQRPEAGEKIKFYQSVGVVISRHPPHAIASNLIGLTAKECSSKAENERLRLKMFWIESMHPKDQCIAQHPESGCPVADRTIIVYCSKGQTPVRIVPNVCGMSLADVRERLKSQGIDYSVMPQEFAAQDDPSYQVIAQKPIPGSFVDMTRDPHMQLYVHQDMAFATAA